MRATTGLALLGLAASVAGCTGSAPTAPAPVATPAAPAAAPPPPAAGSTVAAAPIPPLPEPPHLEYDSRGRRDPFESLEVREGASGPTVASARLTGIVRSGQDLLALVETADGLGYILKPGDTLGDGRLVEIGSDSVVFRVPARTGSTTDRVVLKLPGD
jgi:hypothetical protein